ncbi:MAG: Uma2 family endonuclease [Oscillospiraceae bacterium]|nr:Uma2 family endonuclease [Oscillospiraceae bacterium]
MEQPRNERRYTYADYCTWDDGERWELIDGVAYMLAAPSEKHQRVSMNFTEQFLSLLSSNGRLYAAPFDVRLDADGEDDTVVQPDLVIICDRSKIDEKGCKGAPDLVIEILSPSNTRYDMWVKFHKYMRAGVREYWMVNPDDGGVMVCMVREGEFLTAMYDKTDTVPVGVLPGCEIDLENVFEDM